MNRIKASRSLLLWLIIFIFSLPSVAQVNTITTNEVTEQVANSSNEKSSTDKLKDLSLTNQEIKDTESDFSSPNASEKTKKYRQQTESGDREWGFYGGSFTFHKDLKGESQKAPVFLVGVRYAWTTKNTSSNRFRYYIDFVPLHIVNYRQQRVVQTSPTTTQTISERKTAFGAGFSPIGIQFNWRNDKKVQPFIAGGLGMVFFNRKFPDQRTPTDQRRIGNWFQITADFGFGVEIRNSEKKSFFIGYKYHHMSNGYSAPLNVGYNTNMVYAGMYFMKKK